ncbi:MAG: hypothetical protein IT210_00590 [Armatimonadetes bacterium]|nr:hypothetical protein [Armatimonadota bacterium]
MPLMHARLGLGYGDADARLATAHQLFEIADRTRLQMFAEAGLPYQRNSVKRYKTYIIASLEREKKGSP